RAAQIRADLLIPVVKAWCTDLGIAVASTGIQGMAGLGTSRKPGRENIRRARGLRRTKRGRTGFKPKVLAAGSFARDRGEAAPAYLPAILGGNTVLDFDPDQL